MKIFSEPRWIARLDQAFWPILYILGILTISLLAESAKAQDLVSVERWRLEKACKELVLLDSLIKDYALKDSVISENKETISSLKSELNNWKHIATERKIRVENLLDVQDTYVREVDVWKRAYMKEKKKRFSVSAGLSYLPLNKNVFGPSITVGYSVYKF